MQPMSFWHLFLNNPEWALVGVGILTMFVIGWQAVETRLAAQASQQAIGIMERQTKATEDAAKATQDSVATIQEQLVLMERQAQATEEAANAAIKTVDVMISRERARIEIEPVGIQIYPPAHPLRLDEVSYKVKCHGTTPATIIETKVWAQITDSDKPYRSESYNSIYIPAVFITTSDGVMGRTPLSSDDALATNGVDVVEMVRKKILFAHFYGFVRYRDIFDGTWVYRFRYIYVPNPWADVQGSWIKHGPPAENTERQVINPN